MPLGWGRFCQILIGAGSICVSQTHLVYSSTQWRNFFDKLDYNTVNVVIFAGENFAKMLGRSFTRDFISLIKSYGSYKVIFVLGKFLPRRQHCKKCFKLLPHENLHVYKKYISCTEFHLITKVRLFNPTYLYDLDGKQRAYIFFINFCFFFIIAGRKYPAYQMVLQTQWWQ